MARRVVGFVSNIKVGVLGTVGVMFLLYTAITLIQKMEEAFNYVWRVRRSRSLVRRFSDYLSVITIGPALVFSAMGLSASVFSARMVRKLALMEPFGTVIATTGQMVPYLLVIAGFSFLYVFIPNTRVRWRAAVVGGTVAGLLWQTTGLLFAAFAAASAQYAAIYSGFAIVLLFIIWLWISWIVLLFGAQVAFFFQHPHQIRLGRGEFRLSNRLKEQTALVIMYLVTERYIKAEEPLSSDSLVHRLVIPGEAVDELLPLLVRHDFLAATEQDGEYRYLPARDPGTISVAEVLRAVRAAEEHGYRAESFRLDVPAVTDAMNRRMERADAALEGRSIRDLVGQATGTRKRARAG
jgi:membrane protein